MSETNVTAQSRKKSEFRNINAIVDLPKYRLPMSGKVSILHRISGFGLFLMLPFLVWVLDKSLTSEATYFEIIDFLGQTWVKVLLILIIWGYLHHFCAGIRFLLLDLHMGIKKEQIGVSATVVLVVSLSLTLFIGLKLFGVL